MAFFNEISKRVNNIAQGAQKAAEIARIQHLASIKQNESDKLMCEIGRIYYTGRKTGEQDTSALNTLCDRADTISAEIEGLNLKLDDLKQIRRCTKCGSIQNNDNRFCSSCGERLNERVIPAQETVEQDAPAVPETQPISADDLDISGFDAQDSGSKSIYIHWPAADSSEDTAEEENEIIEE